MWGRRLYSGVLATTTNACRSIFIYRFRSIVVFQITANKYSEYITRTGAYESFIVVVVVVGAAIRSVIIIIIIMNHNNIIIRIEQWPIFIDTFQTSDTGLAKSMRSLLRLLCFPLIFYIDTFQTAYTGLAKSGIRSVWWWFPRKMYSMTDQ